ncbi:hypothetical protein [Haloarcula sp. K1]|uniref:hypothetical protein n=1 Tax=Haloarcula sp. K1 TaxID=1622207 RepID=UPI0007BBE790|nr:hypothetical protein [Haloarcula sp. K1]KZX46254.1 hypothetical protein AV929_15900 [Haloarcula sp. K1]
MLNILPFGGDSEADSTDPPDDSKEDSAEKLTRAEKVGQLTYGLPQTYRILRSEWKEEKAQFYFLLYSVAAAFAMLFSILNEKQLILYGIFAVYAITAIPLLYIYEEERYFSHDENPFSNDED